MDFTTTILSHPPEDQDSPIFVDADFPERTICWPEYASSVKRIAAGLQTVGLGDGDCVALVSGNDIQYHVLGRGVIAAGGVFAGINPAGTTTEVQSSITSADAKWVSAAPDLLEQAEAAARNYGLPGSRILVFDAKPGVSYSGPLHKFSDLLRSDETAWKPYVGAKEPKNRSCFRILTSGSTGMPKAAEVSHAIAVNRGPMFSDVSGSVARFTSKKCLHVVDMHHVFGISVSGASALGKQVTYISKRGDAASTIDLIE